MKKALILVALCAFAGCSTQLSPQQFAGLEYGPPPENYQERIKSWFRLRDPYSAVWTFEPPRKGYYNPPFGKPTPGWIVAMTVNARNGFGGYVGEQPNRFFFYGGKMDKIDETLIPQPYNYAEQ
jgi:hypothetical protein